MYKLYYLHQGPDDLLAVADGLHSPMKFEVEQLVVGKLPLQGGVTAHTLGEAEEAEGGTDGDIETLGEAVHGYLDVGVGSVDSLLREARQLGAKDEGGGLTDVEVTNHGVVLVRQGGHDAVALCVQVTVDLLYAGMLIVVDPFGGTHGHVAGGVEGVVRLDDMHILHTETVARAKHGGGIMRLINIFEHDGNMARAQRCQAIKQGALIVAKQL